MGVDTRFVAKFSLIAISAYWALGIVIGYLSANSKAITTGYQYTQFIQTSTSLLMFALAIYVVVSIIDLFTLQSKNVKLKINEVNLQLSRIPTYSITIALILGFTYFYNRTGFIPALQVGTGLGAKYYVDIQELYLPLRPLYTFLINFSTSYLTLLIYFYMFLARSRLDKLHAFLNIAILLSLLLLTLKRGPILLPVAYMLVLSYWFGRVGFGRLLVYFFILSMFAVAFWTLSYGNFENIFYRIYASLINSFFVFNREFSRFLEAYDQQLIWGLSYLAAITSFIPTSMNELKDLYLFPRFSLWQEGLDANLSGGPRNSFVAESYANFGIFGIYIMSLSFALVVTRYSRTIAALRLGQVVHSIKPLLLIVFFQQGILAFLENGSAALFHLASKTVFILMIAAFVISQKNRT